MRKLIPITVLLAPAEPVIWPLDVPEADSFLRELRATGRTAAFTAEMVLHTCAVRVD